MSHLAIPALFSLCLKPLLRRQMCGNLMPTSRVRALLRAQCILHQSPWLLIEATQSTSFQQMQRSLLPGRAAIPQSCSLSVFLPKCGQRLQRLPEVWESGSRKEVCVSLMGFWKVLCYSQDWLCQWAHPHLAQLFCYSPARKYLPLPNISVSNSVCSRTCHLPSPSP